MSPPPSFELTDPTEPTPPNALEAWLDRRLVPYLIDPRDVVFTRNAGQILVTVVPFALLVFAAPPWLSLLLGAVYLPFVMARWAGPYVLMLHAVTHRPLFKKPYRRADSIITMGLTPWFGMPPTAYHPHHVLMHHKENNGPDDLSSTVAYQRDRLSHFAHYWLRFAVFGHMHLGSWLLRRGRTGTFAKFVAGEVLYAGTIAALLYVDPVATLIVFVGPFLLLRFFLMAGNWAQHAFVDADEPMNSYTNSTCLLNARYNRRCYNDGYHIVHHRLPGLHWAEMPGAFKKDIAAYVRNDSIVFDGIENNQQIWWCLMRGDYGFLADHLVDLQGRSREEKIAFLKRRVQRTGEARRGLLERREASAVEEQVAAAK